MLTTRIRTIRRVANVVGDVLLVVWVVLWFLAARAVGDLLDSLSGSVGRLGSATDTAAQRIDETARALVGVPLVDPVVTRTIGLLRRRGRSLSPAAQQLYDLFGDVRTKTLRKPRVPKAA